MRRSGGLGSIHYEIGGAEPTDFSQPSRHRWESVFPIQLSGRALDDDLRIEDTAWARSQLRMPSTGCCAVASTSPGSSGHESVVCRSATAALKQLTRHLAAEFREFGVRANPVAPNSIPSIVSTESVAKAIARLDGDTVTGNVLAIDADQATPTRAANAAAANRGGVQ
jgi:NAD(P)-dependent dehydrogenase (short-subunit alcohol dehydrogenase family)